MELKNTLDLSKNTFQNNLSFEKSNLSDPKVLLVLLEDIIRRLKGNKELQ